MNRPESDYELLDSGRGRKLERFGAVTLARPCASAVWAPSLPESAWEKADAWFDRDGGNQWTIRRTLPESWDVKIEGIVFRLSTTSFGHLGVFPEQAASWRWLRDLAAQTREGKPLEVLNLFAYSGGSTLACALAGASVCHLDASKGMVGRARENAGLNNLTSAPIRWIIDDVTKFMQREQRRGKIYDGLILDPPSFGRGKSGEVFKIERDLAPILDLARQILGTAPRFVLMSCHSPSYTPIAMQHVLSDLTSPWSGSIKSGELTLPHLGSVKAVPSGTFALWTSQ